MSGPNLMTEKAAAEVWCPFARVATPDEGPTFNRLDAGRERGQHVDAVRVPRMACCLGSHCALWRWSDNGDLGFCGAAGAP